MRCVHLAWWLALPVAAAPAQNVTLSARTDGLVVSAGFLSKRRPPGPLRHGDGVVVSLVGKDYRAMARSWVEMPPGAPLSFRFRNLAYTSLGPGARAMRSIAGPHSVVFRLTAPRPVAGLLRMRPLLRIATDLTLKYDVGDNGTYEAWKEQNTYLLGRPDVPLVIGRAGVSIRITTWTMTFPPPGYTLSFYNDAYVSLAPPSDLHTEGEPCGPDLGARFDHDVRTGARSLVLDVAGSDVTPFAWVAFGTRPLSLPLPPFGCRLSTDVAVSLPVSVSSQGAARLVVPIAAGHPPGEFRVQYVTATHLPGRGLSWRTSNLVRGVLR